MPLSAFEYLAYRSIGLEDETDFIKEQTRLRLQSLDISSESHWVSAYPSWCLALSPACTNESYLLLGSSHGHVLIYDLDRQEHAISKNKDREFRVHSQKLKAHRSGVTQVAWFVDPGLFLSSSVDKKVHLYDTSTMDIVTSLDLPESINSMDISMFHTSLVLVGTETRGEIRVGDLKSGTTSHVLQGHSGAIRSIQWSKKAPGHEIVSGALDGQVRLWDIRRASSCLMVLDSDTGEALHYPPRHKRVPAMAHRNGVVKVAYTPDSRYLVTSGLDHNMRVWDSGTGRHTLTKYLGTRVYSPNRMPMATIQPNYEGSSMVVHPSTQCSSDLSLYQLQSIHGNPMRVFRTMCSTVTSCVFRKQTEELYCTGVNGMISVASCQSPAIVPEPTSHITQPEEIQGNGDNWSDDEEESSNAFVPPILR